MAHQSFAKTVLDTLTGEVLARGGEVETDALSCALHLQTRKDHKRMLNTLSDLVKSGKVIRVRQGVYALAMKATEPEKREVMWRTLRIRKVVTIADLQEFAGVSHEYAKEWLAMLVKRKVVIRVDPADVTKPRSWRLIKTDLVQMPVDTEKAGRLRALRRKQKQKVFKTLRHISTEIDSIYDTLQRMEDEE